MSDVDPFALDLPAEEITLINEELERTHSSATWEHENLAQVSKLELALLNLLMNE